MVFEILSENRKILTLEGVLPLLIKLVPFYSIWRSKFCDHAIPNFISNFNNHYSDLSKEVYNIFVSQGGQKIPAVKVREMQNFSYLPYKTEGFLSPRTLMASIF